LPIVCVRNHGSAAGEVRIAAVDCGDRMRPVLSEVVNVAVPPLSVPSQRRGGILKRDRPGGVPVADDVTVAVKVTGAPRFDALFDETTEVELATLFTVCIGPAKCCWRSSHRRRKLRDRCTPAPSPEVVSVAFHRSACPAQHGGAIVEVTVPVECRSRWWLHRGRERHSLAQGRWVQREINVVADKEEPVRPQDVNLKDPMRSLPVKRTLVVRYIVRVPDSHHDGTGSHDQRCSPVAGGDLPSGMSVDRR